MKDISVQTFDDAFKVLREGFYKGLSIYQITEMTGLAQNTINRIASGEKSATCDVIKAMCIPAGLGLSHVLSNRTKEEIEVAREASVKRRALKKANRKPNSKSLIKGDES
ncbi:MAG: hypothetical protein V7765_21360 [Oleispira sp.]